MSIQDESFPEAPQENRELENANLEELVQNTMVEVYRIKDKIASKAQLAIPSTPKEPLCPSPISQKHF